MPFAVEQTTINDRLFIHLKNDEAFTATIVPSVGAMLNAMQVRLDGADFNLIDSYPVAEISSESAGNWFKGVKLSPWPCRIPKGKYKFGKNEYQLKKNFKDGTALHGLLYDQPFQLVDEGSNDETAFIVLRHCYEGADPGYPFTYQCDVKYALHPGKLLELQTTVLNLSDEIIPIADGWHPYFQLGGKVDDWNLNFPALSMVEFDEKLIPTGLFVPYQKFNQPKKIGNTQFDNCFFLKIQEYKPICTLQNPANNISLHFYTNPGYSYLQIFIPPHRNSIAIENLSAAPDAFNNHMGLIKLPPGESRSFRVFYQVEVQENG